MTDIEKLAAALESNVRSKTHVLRSTFYEVRARFLFAEMYYLHINIKQLLGLIEGTHVVVPVEPTINMIDAAERECDEPGYQWSGVYKAMIKAAQEDL